MLALRSHSLHGARLAAVLALLLPVVGRANTTCAPGSPCGSACCAPGTNCDPLNNNICCDALHPVACAETCCPFGNTCNTASSSPQLCCDPQHPVQCAHTCCPPNGTCSPDGFSCGASCPPRGPECN